jgi:2'-5' RNA ligase
VAFAVSLSSSHASAAAITALWDQVSAFEETPSMRALNYPPHISFAVYDSPEVTEAMAVAAMRHLAEGRTPIELRFDRIRSFAGSPLVLWADPEPKDTLLEMHLQVHSTIDPVLCRPHYRPGNWIPHCTLAINTLPGRNNEALAFAESFRANVRVVFDKIDCIKYPPVSVVAETRLSA